VPSLFRRSHIAVLGLLALGASVAVAVPGAALAETPAKAARLGDRTLRPGDSGDDVRQLQEALNEAGFAVDADGEFGMGTEKAVKRFQRAARHSPTGTVGKRTIAALKRALRSGTANVNGGFDPERADEKRGSLGDRIPVRAGMSGHDIRVLQDFLRKAGFRVAIDGEFGTSTLRAVRRFETALERPVDGVVDAADITTLRTAVGEGDPAMAEGPLQLGPGDTATVGADGLAIAPESAPDAVKKVIEAGNRIARKPYRYGGGHGSWNDSGYDCSGSVSYALHGGGLLDSPLPSSGFFDWGDAGEGQWITIYTKSSHMYMVVAGLRFDTSGRSRAGTRWQADMRSTAGYEARHPAGL